MEYKKLILKEGIIVCIMDIYIRINFKEGNDIKVVFKIILEKGKDVIKVVFLLVKGFFFLLWKIIELVIFVV